MKKIGEKIFGQKKKCQKVFCCFLIQTFFDRKKIWSKKIYRKIKSSPGEKIVQKQNFVCLVLNLFSGWKYMLVGRNLSEKLLVRKFIKTPYQGVEQSKNTTKKSRKLTASREFCHIFL